MRSPKHVAATAFTYALPAAAIGWMLWPSDQCKITGVMNSLTGGPRVVANAIPVAGEGTEVVIDTAAVQPESSDPSGFVRTVRPGSVDLEAEYDLTDLSIPMEQIHTLLPRDAIPALTDPELESIEAAGEWLSPDDRVIDVTVLNKSVGVPLRILTYHEIANMTVAGMPVAATYCPLCDSVTLISRTVQIPDPEADPDGPTVMKDLMLEFGVSGALFNSNVLMYDQETESLWSQLGTRAVSGPHVGTGLTHLPVRIVTFERFSETHPEGLLVSRETGHERPYEEAGYAGYFETDDLLVDVFGTGRLREDLPKKTLGLGVMHEGRAWFVTAEALGEGYTLHTPIGPVSARRTPAGVEVLSLPRGVITTQTFYYSWASFFPDVVLIQD